MTRGLAPVLFAIAAVLLILSALPGPADQPITPAGEPLEVLGFGRWDDDVRLVDGAPPAMLYRVPTGHSFWLTDVDAACAGLVVLRRAGHAVEQVAFAVDRGGVGIGQSARSFVTGIPFRAGEEILVQAAGSDVEWVSLKGVLRAGGLPD